MSAVAQSIDTKDLISLLKSLDGALQKSLRAVELGSAPKDQHKPKDGAEPVTVYIRVVFIKVGDINTLQEHFGVDAFVQARWREPRLDRKVKRGQKTGEHELPNWGDYWNPQLLLENALGDVKESVWYVVSYDKEGQATVYERRRVRGTFFESMELKEYPFDAQALTLTITTQRGEQEVDLDVDPSEISAVNIQSFVDAQEWQLHRHISSGVKVTTNVYKSSKYKHPAVSVSCRASRKFHYFVWNIILIMIFICSLVFTTFVVDTDLVQNRLQLSFILMLSNIAFKFNISQTLPKVPYLTVLDLYVILSMAILALACIWHAVVYLIFLNYGTTTADFADMVAVIVIGGFYVIFNAAFFFHNVFIVKQRQKTLREKDMKQKEMMRLMKKDKTKRMQILPVVEQQEEEGEGEGEEKRSETE